MNAVPLPFDPASRQDPYREPGIVLLRCNRRTVDRLPGIMPLGVSLREVFVGLPPPSCTSRKLSVDARADYWFPSLR